MKPETREDVLARFDRNRIRTRRFFEALDDELYYSRPIPLRHPFVFYEGHIPAFNAITLLRRALGRRPIDAKLETLFARGIDPKSEDLLPRENEWPARSEVLAYVAEADRAVRHALEHDQLEDDGNPLLVRAEAVYCIIEHEEMHQETLRYMLRRSPITAVPVHVGSASSPSRARSSRIRIPGGRVKVGAARSDVAFGWDNEFDPFDAVVRDFSIDSLPVTNAEFLEFIESGAYERRDLWSEDAWAWRAAHWIRHPGFWIDDDGWYWRSMNGRIPLPLDWPAWVSHAEAEAYARWKNRRLPSEPEFLRAAYGDPTDRERLYPWGDDEPDESRGNFDFASEEAVAVGSHPRGASAWGVEELVGNGWEWTSTPFAPFPGFRAMPSYPQYSADFFDGEHFVMKGASPATAKPLLRRSFRNWFYSTYPYVFAKFRLVD